MSDLNAGVEALTATLAEEERIYTSLLTLAGFEERAIDDGDVSELTDLTEQKEQLLEVVATLETERMTALVAIAAATDLETDALTLSRVIEAAEPEQGAALTEVGVLVRARAVALKQANERNAALLRSRSDVVERWIDFLRKVVSGSLTYTAEGSPQEPDGSRVLDQSA